MESFAPQDKQTDTDIFFNEDQEVKSDFEEVNSYLLVIDRSRREIKPPLRFGYADLIAYALSVTSDMVESEPESYKEAISCDHSKQWIEAI